MYVHWLQAISHHYKRIIIIITTTLGCIDILKRSEAVSPLTSQAL